MQQKFQNRAYLGLKNQLENLIARAEKVHKCTTVGRGHFLTFGITMEAL